MPFRGSPYKANNRMPCKSCIKVNSKLYDDLDRVFLPNIKINHEANLKKLEFEELLNYEYKNYELGKLCTLLSFGLKEILILLL